jgi:hypothetical protein
VANLPSSGEDVTRGEYNPISDIPICSVSGHHLLSNLDEAVFLGVGIFVAE